MILQCIIYIILNSYGEIKMIHSELFENLKHAVEIDAPMSSYTYFGVGGPGDYLPRPWDVEGELYKKPSGKNTFTYGSTGLKDEHAIITGTVLALEQANPELVNTEGNATQTRTPHKKQPSSQCRQHILAIFPVRRPAVFWKGQELKVQSAGFSPACKFLVDTGGLPPGMLSHSSPC